jgi:hypothetical protein
LIPSLKVNALLHTALDKAEFSSDNKDEDNDAAKALVETFNRAISMNTSQIGLILIQEKGMIVHSNLVSRQKKTRESS